MNQLPTIGYHQLGDRHVVSVAAACRHSGIYCTTTSNTQAKRRQLSQLGVEPVAQTLDRYPRLVFDASQLVAIRARVAELGAHRPLPGHKTNSSSRASYRRSLVNRDPDLITRIEAGRKHLVMTKRLWDALIAVPEVLATKIGHRYSERTVRDVLEQKLYKDYL